MNGKLPTRPLYSACMSAPLQDSLWTLMLECWDGEPARRPTISEILSFFRFSKDSSGQLGNAEDTNDTIPLSLPRDKNNNNHQPKLIIRELLMCVHLLNLLAVSLRSLPGPSALMSNYFKSS
jgi:hypothetical protein